MLSEDVSFLNRASIKRTLDHLPAGTRIEIDASRTVSLDHDVYEIIKQFRESAPGKGIDVSVLGLSTLHQDDGTMRRASIEPRTGRTDTTRASRIGLLLAQLLPRLQVTVGEAP